jgi:PelA/Pel-15E family pectate lyase
VEFFRHKTDFDVVVVTDQKAPPLWARMYEVGTDRPIFASRDGVKVYSLAEVDRERRTGSGWYGSWPRELLEQEYPRWRKQAGS